MKILIAGYHPYSQTGLGKVANLFFKTCVELKHKVVFIAVQDQQLGHFRGKTGEIYPYDAVKNQLSNFSNCDLIITLGDLWRYEFIYHLSIEHAIPWIPYIGVEGQTYPDNVTIDRDHKLSLSKMLEITAEIWAYTSESERILKTKFPDKKMTILNHAVDVDGIRKTAPLPLREILNMPNDKKLALFVGDNITRKGLDLFFLWLWLNPEWIGYCHSPSNRSHGYNLKEMRASLEIGDRLWLKEDLVKAMNKTTFTDNEIIGIYKAADLFLHPHRAEGFGLCVLEALVCKIPVLATNTGGPSTYLPKKCKIDVSHEIYLQLGGVGYVGQEPDFNMMIKATKKDHGRHDFQPLDYDMPAFKKNLNQLLNEDHVFPLWIEV